MKEKILVDAPKTQIIMRNVPTHASIFGSNIVNERNKTESVASEIELLKYNYISQTIFSSCNLSVASILKIRFHSRIKF